MILLCQSAKNSGPLSRESDLEVAKERVHEQVDDNERREDDVENAHEDEAALEAMQ